MNNNEDNFTTTPEEILNSLVDALRPRDSGDGSGETVSSVTSGGSALEPTVQGLTAVGSQLTSLTGGLSKLTGSLGALSTLSPIVAGLVALFGGGGGSSTPAPLEKIERPASINYQGLVSESTGEAWTPMDRAEGEQPRTLGGAPAPVQVVVQVQALDARSLLDRRDDVAAAVRQALLESNSLGDVLSEV
jgi:hypothetical protein